MAMTLQLLLGGFLIHVSYSETEAESTGTIGFGLLLYSGISLVYVGLPAVRRRLQPQTNSEV